MKEELIDVIIDTSTETTHHLQNEHIGDNENGHEKRADFNFYQGLGGCCVGELTGFTDAGEPMVKITDDKSEHIIRARSTQSLTHEYVGKKVAFIFENGDLKKPIVIGVIQNPAQTSKTGKLEKGSPVNAEIDGEKLTFTAEKEIVLRCGKASLTLTRAGKVIIRGAYLLSRSSGVNRIKGGSVQIN